MGNRKGCFAEYPLWQDSQWREYFVDAGGENGQGESAAYCMGKDKRDFFDITDGAELFQVADIGDVCFSCSVRRECRGVTGCFFKVF